MTRHHDREPADGHTPPPSDAYLDAWMARRLVKVPTLACDWARSTELPADVARLLKEI